MALPLLSRSRNPRRSGNKKLAKIYYETVMNRADIAAIPTILGDDFEFTIPTHPEVFRGIEGFREEVLGLHGAFPDVHLDVHHKWIFDDLILGLWTGTGTHIGDKPLSTPNGPLPATGRAFRIEGVSWIRADGTQLRENLANEDTLRIIHDLGVMNFSALYGSASASVMLRAQLPGATVHQALNTALCSDKVTLDHPLLPRQVTGRAKLGSFFSCYWNAFENIDFQITHSKSGDGVHAYRWIFEADHVRRFFSIPASGKRLHHQGVTVCILDAQGDIDHLYVNENLFVLLMQMQSANQGM